MTYPSALRRAAISEMVDALLETEDELEDVLSEHQHPRDLLSEEDLAEEGVKRCPRCRKWINESDCEDLDAGTCYLCSATAE